jgi:hypothetical protein
MGSGVLMARVTASDMIDIVRDSLGGETTETISDTRILRYINQSYLEIASDHHFPQLSTSTTITTASGTAAYELSVSNVLKFEDMVDDTNNHLLYRMSEWQYHKFTQGSTTSGVPTYWYVSGVGSNDRYEITFWPTPAGTYTINVYYIQKPDELVASPTATSAVISEPWDDSIIYRAVARGWMQLGDPDVAAKWRGMAKQNDSSALNSSFEPSYIRVRPGSVIGRALRDV